MIIRYEGIILGEPVGKGRPRVVRTAAGVRGITPKKTRDWTAYAVGVLAWGWKGAPPLTGPVMVVMRAIKARPKRLHRKRDPEGLMWRPRKPDADNTLKSLLDSLTKAGVLQDDAIVVHAVAYSLYAEKGGKPRMEVVVSSIDTPYMPVSP